jgi:carbamoyltransferase
MVTVSIYGSHHAAVAIERDGEYFILEAEQFLNRLGSGLTHFDPSITPDLHALEMYHKLRKDFSIYTTLDRYLYGDLGISAPFFVHLFQAQRAERRFVGHHHAHAANAFYQSPFDEALVITCDSGGDDGVFNIHLYNRNKAPETVARLPLNLGYTFSMFGPFFRQMRADLRNKGAFLRYPKKLMNLAAFGDVQSAWLGPIENLFRGEPLTPDTPNTLPPDPYNVDDLNRLAANIANLMSLPVFDGLDGIQAYDFAATVQRALENVFMAAIAPYLEAYPSLPICLGGGVANNIYLNRRIREETGRDLYVPLNADNSGIALGMILAYNEPTNPVNLSHVGPHLLDRDKLSALSQGRNFLDVTARQVAMLLSDGKILGIARGRASHGSYSLGARSIVCDAATPRIAPLIRHTITGSPTYVPFDALVRAERLSEYVMDAGTVAYPNYPLMLKSKYKSLFPGIAHVDGTARIYSVDKVTNPWLHEVLRWFETYNSHGVLLTTPLCKEHEPTVSTIEAGLNLLNNTQLEGLLVEDRLFWRPAHAFNQSPGVNYSDETN